MTLPRAMTAPTSQTTAPIGTNTTSAARLVATFAILALALAARKS